MAPPGRCAVSAEVSHSVESPVERETLEERVVADLHTMKILSRDDKVLFTYVIEMPYAYAIYDQNRASASITAVGSGPLPPDLAIASIRLKPRMIGYAKVRIDSALLYRLFRWSKRTV